MRKELKPVLILSAVALAVILLTAYLTTNNVALFNSKGVVAQKEQNLIITAVSLMLIIIVPLLVTAYFFAWKYREGRGQKYSPEGDNGVKGGLLWWVLPILVVGSLIVVGWRGAHELDPYKALAGTTAKPLTIQVVALNWKWLFIYPEQKIATVNFVEFPTNTPLNFRLTADGPMNSFWIPQLGGQMYAMSGMVTPLHLIATQNGEYMGQAAEINGDGYAGMRFTAKASSQSDFDSWVNTVKQTGARLTWDEYNKLVRPSQNNPRAYYSSIEQDQYNQIIMKFMAPTPSPTPVEDMGSMPGMHM